MPTQKVLQIIHVTDLHVGCEGVNAYARHVRERNRIKLYLIKFLQRHNLFGWEEGTQTHFPSAPEAFNDFLVDLRAAEPEWFESTPNWFVDTGDLTTFGDEASIREGKQYLENWASTTGACETRHMYGNHDAWPETQPFTQPFVYNDDIAKQQQRLFDQYPEWRPERWRYNPLQTPIPHMDASIELYSLDSVAWDLWRSVRAVGLIDPPALYQLRDLIQDRRRAGHTRDFRILTTHHPIAFPYEAKEARVFGLGPIKMRLENADEVAECLRSEPPHLSEPLVHMMISGHAHARYPGRLFDGEREKLRQKGLDSKQLQVVGSSLMLNRDSTIEHIASDSSNEFDLAGVDHNTCQADLLRFSIESKQTQTTSGKRQTLLLERIPIVGGVDGTEYNLLPSRAQKFYWPL